MKRWVRVGTVTLGAALGGLLAASAAATALWGRATARAVERLASAPARPGADEYSPEELEGLPAPVARYFHWALSPGQPMIRAARIEHAGDFRSSLRVPWSPFTSVQHVSGEAPGFVWDARIRMTPGVSVRVRDSYISGRAAMLGRVAALVPVVHQEGSPELASGALHRYLAEAAWVPTALLPSRGVRWEAIDDSTARATLRDAGTTVSLEVGFGEEGAITRVAAERYRDVNGVGVLTPWEGHFWGYQEIDGMRVPLEGEVAWVLPEGRHTYWRGRIVRADYQLAGE